MRVNENSTLFVQALSVINKAIRENKDSLPYKQVMTVGEKLAGGRNVGVPVYSDDPETPHDYYTIRLKEGQFELVEHGKQDPEVTWKVPVSYLQKLVDNADDYVKHPAKMDLHWLLKRLNIGE